MEADVEGVCLVLHVLKREREGVGGGYSVSLSLRPPPLAPSKPAEGRRRSRRAADRGGGTAAPTPGDRGDGRRLRMRGIGGSVPSRGAAAHPGAGRGEPGEDPGCGVRTGGAGGEPGAEAQVCGAGDRAGDPQEGVGAVAGGGCRRSGVGGEQAA